MSNKVCAGIDLGGTKILALLLDEQGGVVYRSETATQAHEGPEAVIGRMVGLILETA